MIHGIAPALWAAVGLVAPGAAQPSAHGLRRAQLVATTTSGRSMRRFGLALLGALALVIDWRTDLVAETPPAR